LTQQHEQLATFHLQVDAIDRANVAKALAESLDPNHVPILVSSRAASLQLS